MKNYPCILKLFLIPNAKISEWSGGASHLYRLRYTGKQELNLP